MEGEVVGEGSEPVPSHPALHWEGSGRDPLHDEFEKMEDCTRRSQRDGQSSYEKVEKEGRPIGRPEDDERWEENRRPDLHPSAASVEEE